VGPAHWHELGRDLLACIVTCCVLPEAAPLTTIFFVARPQRMCRTSKANGTRDTRWPGPFSADSSCLGPCPGADVRGHSGKLVRTDASASGLTTV